MAADIGTVRARYILDSQQWEAGLVRVVGSVEAANQGVKAELASVQAAVGGTTQAISDAGAQAEAAASKLTFADAARAGVANLQLLSDGLGAFRAEIVRAGGEADDLRDRLAGPFKDAAEEIATLSEQQIVIGIDPNEAAAVLTTLNKFGLASQDNLRLVEDLAAGTGDSIQGVAEKIGRIAELGDPKAFRSLTKEIGATVPELQALGVAFDENNNALLDTEARVNAAVGALRTFTQSEFGGAAERMADDTTRLTGELELLKREVGASVIAFREQFAPAGRQVVAVLREMPEPLKTFVGLGTEFIGIGASMATTGLQVAANFAIIGQNAALMNTLQLASVAAVGALRTAFLGLLGAMTPAVILLGSVAAAFAITTAEMNKANAAAEEFVKIEERQAKALRENKDLLSQTAKDLQDQGKTAKDLSDTIGGLQDQVRAARNAGNNALANQLAGKVREAINLRNELAQLELDAKNPKPSTGPEKSVEQEAKDRAAREKAEKDLAVRVAKEKAAAERQAIEQELRASQQEGGGGLDRVKQLLQQKQALQIQDVKAERDALLAITQNQQTRASIIEAADIRIRTVRAETVRAIEDAEKKVADVEKKTADEARKRADAEKADVQRQVREKVEAEKSALDTQIRGLEGDLGNGAQVTGRIAGLLRQKLALTIREIQAERDQAVAATQNEEVRAAAVETAEARIRAARQETEQQIQAARDKAAKQKAQADAQDAAKLKALGKEQAQLQGQDLDRQIRELESKGGGGKALENARKRRLEFTIQQIEAERDATVEATNNAEVKAKAEEVAEARIRAAKAETTRQIQADNLKQIQSNQAVTDQKQPKKPDVLNLTGEVKTFEQVQAELSSAFGFGPSKDLITPGQRVQAEKDRAAALKAQLDQKALEGAAGGAGGAADVGKTVADAITKTPINISLQVNGQTQQVVSGTPDELQRAQTTFNPDFQLGRA